MEDGTARYHADKLAKLGLLEKQRVGRRGVRYPITEAGRRLVTDVRELIGARSQGTRSGTTMVGVLYSDSESALRIVEPLHGAPDLVATLVAAITTTKDAASEAFRFTVNRDP